MGSNDEAKLYYEASLEMTSKIYGEGIEKETKVDIIDSHQSFSIHTSYGAFCFNNGMLDEAEEHFQKAVDVLEKIGSESRLLITPLNNLGTVLFLREKYEESKSLMERSLSLALEAFGEDHPEVADIYQNLGNQAKKRKDSEEAVKMYQKELRIRELTQNTAAMKVALESLISSFEFSEKTEEIPPLRERLQQLESNTE